MTKEEFLALAGQKWEKIQAKKEGETSFYDYEKAFDELWTEFGRQTLEGSLGKRGKDRRKKKASKSFWEN